MSERSAFVSTGQLPSPDRIEVLVRQAHERHAQVSEAEPGSPAIPPRRSISIRADAALTVEAKRHAHLAQRAREGERHLALPSPGLVGSGGRPGAPRAA